MIDKIEKALSNLREQKPLILNLTNFVTQDFVANSLLSLGAAPIMSQCEDELKELIQICSAVYINIGTLDNNFIKLAKKAIKLAGKYHKHIVFDPVGAGATRIRTQTAQYIMPFSTIIRGNASEIIALNDGANATKGVEATHKTEDAKEIAKLLAQKNKAIVIVSGPVDFITDGKQSAQVIFGSSLMQLVTGMGCAMTAVIAAFKAIVDDPFEAGLIGCSYFALCGEITSLNHHHPGAFRTALLDQLHMPNFELMNEMIRREL